MNGLLTNAAVNGEGPKMEHMEPWKRVLRVVAPMVLAGAVAAALLFASNGVPVFGAPNPRDVESVTVAWAQGGTGTYTDPERIELAVNLINALNCQPFTPVSDTSRELGPDVTVSYRLKGGRELTAAANWVTGWWNGEARALKKPDMFVKLAEGVLYPDSITKHMEEKND